MRCLTCGEIAQAACGEIVCGSSDVQINYITTDSREAGSGMLFVPIAGERFDGHDFIKNAFEQGASAVITHKDIAPEEGKVIIRVEDTFKAFGDIAAYHKAKYKIPTVAVTGSVGKTTTKDMISGVMETTYKTLKTQGNFNNEIGVPITVLSQEKDHEAAVIEMGMSAFGEIERLASIVRPDIAVITNIGMSHIENLGSREGIFKAKMEVTKLFDEKNVLIVNGDDDYLSTLENDTYRIVFYGINNDKNSVYAEDIQNFGVKGIRFTACVDGEKYQIEVNVAGEHNIYNALAAICVGRELKIPMEKIIEGIRGFKLTKMRMSVSEINGMTVINDCYNASPDSVNAALRVLKSMKSRRRVAVLGDILEMGDYAKDAHYDLGKSVVDCGADMLIAVGSNAKYMAQGAKDSKMQNVIWFENTDEANEHVSGILEKGDAVLIKASRGMHFENILKTIEEEQHE